MTKNTEIEFKTVIPYEKYKELMALFDLYNIEYKQTNYYFDTDDNSLESSHIVLRIRQKSDNYFKLTLKSQGVEKAYENHLLITKDKAEELLKNGFHTKDFFDQIDYFVTYKVSLENLRASFPYESGKLFVDRCDYCGQTDYEIEYEVNDYHQGKRDFLKFLEKHNIVYEQTKRKSERAFACKR
ncbi:MAG: CYTH domain-containing protein [Acholeplasmataceae bacterium]